MRQLYVANRCVNMYGFTMRNLVLTEKVAKKKDRKYGVKVTRIIPINPLRLHTSSISVLKSVEQALLYGFLIDEEEEGEQEERN